jgi:ribosomal protein S18 acetylase RimI-like enzyme
MIALADSVARVTYYKRYKMEADLRLLPPLETLAGFRFLPWTPALMDTHAEVLFESFHREIDAFVFPSFGDRLGCVCLMTEITRKHGFEPEATWLLADSEGRPCGSVQGIRERSGLGAIQNLGILPAWRGRGLGSALLVCALHGFYRAGLGRALLEVTAQNDGALRLYRRLGFRSVKTLYKAVPDPRMLVEVNHCDTENTGRLYLL